MHPLAIILIVCALSVGPVKAPSATSTINAIDVPPIEEVQRRAIEYARLEPKEISSWKKRARASALLPRLQLEYERRLRYNVDVDVNDSVYVGSNGVTIGPEEGGYTQNHDNDQNIGVKAVWAFNEAVFNPDMLGISEEARMLARERQAILAEVNKNYYERLRLAGEIPFLEGELRRTGESSKIRHEIFMKGVQIDEAGAALDALTGGWFSRQLKPSGGR